MKNSFMLYDSNHLGIVFDNKVNNETVVEQVVRQSQAEISDIQTGDRLVYIEHFNMTTAAPKVSQKMLSNLPWPMVLVFKTRIRCKYTTIKRRSQTQIDEFVHCISSFFARNLSYKNR